MLDSPDELLRGIRLGEDSSLEIKEVSFRGSSVSRPTHDALADELAAMANTRDGVLVLGVEDRMREIVGIPIDRLDAVEQYVFEVCNESIEPPLPFLSFRIELPDAAGVLRPLFKVEIPRSLFVTEVPGATSIGRDAQSVGCRPSFSCALGSSGVRLVCIDSRNRQCQARRSQISSRAASSVSRGLLRRAPRR